MQSKSNPATELDQYWQTASYSHTATVAELVLENYGAGYAWLRPEEPAEDDEALFVLTEQGRRAVARSRFLDHGPTVAEASQA